MKNIVLIGLMGCGKTTLSKKLGNILNRPVIDIDEYIENKYSMSIPEMFAISEDYFRDREGECCKDISMLDGYIIATGGGIIKRKENIDYLRNNGIVIYIDRPIINILEDVDTSSRPLLKDGPQKLYELYNQRHQLYLDACDYHIINDGTQQDVLNKILTVMS